MLQDKKNGNSKNQTKPQANEPDEVEIMMEKLACSPLNTAKSVFDNNLEKQFGGVNSLKSVFDRTTIFQTSSKTKE